MSPDPNDKPFSESYLESPEYRRRLMRKLNTLIAVLEVACAKVRQSLAAADPDVLRLTRIHKNLQETLKVCKRAKLALERCEKLPDGLPAELTALSRNEHVGPQQTKRTPTAENVELSSPEEIEKFSKLGPIQSKDLRAVDLDRLCEQLVSGE